jgi:adenylate kinase
MIALFFGPPGSGKGTQAQRVAERARLPHVATGEILRAEVAKGSDLGREVQPIMDSGGLVPDDLVVRVIEARLRDPDAAVGALLDGFPRTLPQARALDTMLRKRGSGVDTLMVLRVPDAELWRRMERRAHLEGRRDDTAESFQRRLRIYREETTPVVGHYRAAGARIAEIDGVGTIDEVTARIAAALAEPGREARAS